MMRPLGPNSAKIAASLMIVLTLAACGGGKSTSPTKTPATQNETAPSIATQTIAPSATVAASQTGAAAMTPAGVLQRASKQLAATQTVAFNLAVSGETFVDTNDTIQLLDAKGSLVRPDQVYTEFKVKLAKQLTITMKLITIGDKHWTTDLITGKWGAAPEEFGYNPSILFDNQNGIGPVMDKITNAIDLGNDKVQGRECYHIQANVTQDVIGLLTSNSMQGDVSVELWIDTENFNLLQAKLIESPSVTTHQPATWVLSLTDQDKKMTIAAPDAPYSVSSPVASPIASPVASPIASPVASPMASLVSSTPIGTPGAPG
jgi:hypothetical protein